MQHATRLTETSLNLALDAVSASKSADDIASALVAASALIQAAIQANQPSADFHAALRGNWGHVNFSQVFEHAINFQTQADGELSLWLLPVTLTSVVELPSLIPLELETLANMRLSGALNKQLGLSAADLSTELSGWAYLLPGLFSSARISQTDIAELIRLPQQARAAVRGMRKEPVTFTGAAQTYSVSPGTMDYYLPFVVYSPVTGGHGKPEYSELTETRMSRWATTTLSAEYGDAVTIESAGTPEPFTYALDSGAKMRLVTELDMEIGRLQALDVSPNGLAAMVAPYEVRNQNGIHLLGVTLVSRLTGQVLSTLALQLNINLDEAVELASDVLAKFGVAQLERLNQPVHTHSCQHCGEIQYAMPSLESLRGGIHEASKSMH